MNKIAIFSAIASLFLTSCTKVIELDLNSADPQIVVEAQLSDNANQKATVRLSKTVNFNQSNTFPPLSNAQVFIKNRTTNEVDTLKETSAGFYQGTKLVGKVGNTYDLTIQTGGKTITSSATIPRKVNLDSIGYITQSLFGRTRISLVPRFLDPVGLGDNYRFLVTTNDTLSTAIHIQNDDLADGKYNARPLFGGGGGGPSQTDLKSGDKVSLEMQCIDKGVYTYFSTLEEGGGSANSNSGTPTNPVTNLTGAVLGYFSAYTTQTKTVIIK